MCDFSLGYYITEPNILFDLSKSNFISRNCMSQDSCLDTNYKKGIRFLCLVELVKFSCLILFGYVKVSLLKGQESLFMLFSLEHMEFVCRG